jgi:hypothetical protein
LFALPACGEPEAARELTESAVSEELRAADYVLSSKYSGLSLEVAQASREDAGRVVQWSRASRDRQV